MKSYRNFVVNTNHEMSISLHLVYNYWRNCSTNTHIKGWVKWYHGICSLLFYIIHLESLTMFLFYKIKIVYLKILLLYYFLMWKTCFLFAFQLNSIDPGIILGWIIFLPIYRYFSDMKFSLNCHVILKGEENIKYILNIYKYIFIKFRICNYRKMPYLNDSIILTIDTVILSFDL